MKLLATEPPVPRWAATDRPDGELMSFGAGEDAPPMPRQPLRRPSRPRPEEDDDFSEQTWLR